jgi:uncharacterized membrane protein YhaH (DUF805 family)
MARYNPFSFKGEIGRLSFWMFLAFTNAITLAALLLPVSVHVLRLSPPHGIGEEAVTYATLQEPATPQGWAFLVLFYALKSAVLWVVLAAMVRRMRDLGRDLRWLAGLLALFAIHLILEALFSRPDAPYSLFEFANLALLVPVILLGTYGLFEMMLVRGIARRPAGDLRGAIR